MRPSKLLGLRMSSYESINSNNLGYTFYTVNFVVEYLHIFIQKVTSNLYLCSNHHSHLNLAKIYSLCLRFIFLRRYDRRNNCRHCCTCHYIVCDSMLVQKARRIRGWNRSCYIRSDWLARIHVRSNGWARKSDNWSWDKSCAWGSGCQS